MTDNKVVIKINLDRKPSPITAAPQTITVWHTRRILVAVLALVMLTVILVSWLGDESINDDTQIASAEKVQKNSNDNAANLTSSLPDMPAQPVLNGSAAEPPANKKQAAINKPDAVIYSRKVIRASLNASLKDNEPGEAVKLPLNIGRNQSIELFYFTESKNIADKVLFHQWLRNGQVVHQKQLDIKSQRAKNWSSKVFSSKDRGEWQVRLSDKKSKVYSEINFLVNAE